MYLFCEGQRLKQNGHRYRAEHHPETEALFTCPKAVGRADTAAEHQHREPAALKPLRREAEAGDVQYQLGYRDDREEHPGGKQERAHHHRGAAASDRLCGRVRDEPEQGKVNNNNTAQLKEAPARILRDYKALGQTACKGAEKI